MPYTHRETGCRDAGVGHAEVDSGGAGGRRRHLIRTMGEGRREGIA